MTDKEVADKVYIEPLTIEFLEKVIEKERPDSLLAGMSGQTGLNIAVELSDNGILEKYNVRVIGTSIEAIKKGEDRELFRNLMQEINQPVVESAIATDIAGRLNFASERGYPVIVRPAYTMGGSGGGIAETQDELVEILELGLQLSSIGQIILEKSIKGWKEIEYEVMRDGNGNCITICNMENVDLVGIHTGDGIVVALSRTLSDKEYQMLRNTSIDIINNVGIEGGYNVQLALSPKSFEYAVIEINPRVSRSSALASKATGYPIAKVTAKTALGYASVYSVIALRKLGIETIIVNNNPETISTDFDISDRLYFEPLTEEEVFNIVEKENPDGVILQFGGQTVIKLAKVLKEKIYLYTELILNKWMYRRIGKNSMSF